MRASDISDAVNTILPDRPNTLMTEAARVPVSRVNPAPTTWTLANWVNGARAVCTKAVEAIALELSATDGVGVVGVPVRFGELIGAGAKLNAVLISADVKTICPMRPNTEITSVVNTPRVKCKAGPRVVMDKSELVGMAFLTKAVVAIAFDESDVKTVGAVGVPLKIGE